LSGELLDGPTDAGPGTVFRPAFGGERAAADARSLAPITRISGAAQHRRRHSRASRQSVRPRQLPPGPDTGDPRPARPTWVGGGAGNPSALAARRRSRNGELT